MPGLVASVTDERQMLLGFLEQQRYNVRLAAYGLTDAEIRSTPSVSALSVGAVAKHLALVEGFWMQVASDSFDANGSQDEYQRGLQMGENETTESVLDMYAAAAKATDELICSLDLDAQVPVPKGVPWFPQDVESWSIRWIVLHLIEETARHAGHADIVRESIDGATAFPLMAAAEGWPATPWIEPWQGAS